MIAKWGKTFVRIESDRIEEVQAEIDRLHGQVKFIGPEKSGDTYIALGMKQNLKTSWQKRSLT